MPCFGKIPVPKKVMDKREGGSILKFSQKLFVSQCQKNSWRNASVLCFRKTPIAKAFMDKTGGYQTFPSKNFVS